MGKSDRKKMSNGRKFASDNPLSYEKAKKQLTALHINEHKNEPLKFKIKKINEDGVKGYKICCENNNKKKYNPKKLYKKKEEASAAVQLLEGNKDI